MDKEISIGNENMDGGGVDWREGKVSGVVYRTYTYFSLIPLTLIYSMITRWRCRPYPCDPHCLRAICGL